MPQDTQLMLQLVRSRGGMAHPLSRTAKGSRKYPRNTVARRRPKARLDDPQVIPPAVPGQCVLFPAHRTITSDHLSGISDRRWPEWDLLASLVAEVATERGVSETWQRLAARRLRAVLSMRDDDGELGVAPEYLDQVPGSATAGVLEVLRRAGLLLPRKRPRPVRWPTGSCGHCGCWGVTQRLCRGCECWKHDTGRYPTGSCGRCRRELPLSAQERLCRGCLVHVREHGEHDRAPFTQLQLALGKHPVRQLKHRADRLGYDTTDRSWGKRHTARARRRPVPRTVSAHLADPHHLVLFTLDRDWSRVAARNVDELHAMTTNAQQLLEEFTQFCRAQMRRVNPDPHGHAGALRALRIVLAHLGAAAPDHERDLRALAVLDRNINAPRVIGFLAQRGMLIPDPARTADRHLAAVDRLIASFPAPMDSELRRWVTVLQGQGRRRHPALPTATIRSYLQCAAPTLRMWTEHTTTLAAITRQDIRDVLDLAPGRPARTAQQYLRSIFRALKQERLVFHDPTRGITLPAQVRLPSPVPSDRLTGLLQQAHTPLARLLVALVAVHALLPSQAAEIQLDKLDLAHGALRLPRRTIYLETLTTELLTQWLRMRQQTWPACSNPHLLVSSQTALDPSGPPVSKMLLSTAFDRTGLTARALWQDRVLNEARHSADPVHLMRLFAISDSTAMKYVHAAHPEKTGRVHP
ncbi:hypothetical protein HRW23_33410 [Streptomyces lunaelactis]|uniref:hypothetical protein n=1 Tax=Streptomyces lunaelactis TaxID=1535768 RepID=UPI0015853EE6|nr:hypothetical protein [Streptomyces lunaelactis]